MLKLDYPKIYNSIVQDLPTHRKEVLERRFGLGKFPQRETLQSIGNRFGVTRERIRQIEKNNLELLAKRSRNEKLKELFSYFENYLSKRGGFRREDLLLDDLAGGENHNYIYFFLNFAPKFSRFLETEDYYTFWSYKKSIEEKIRNLLQDLLDKLQDKGRPLEIEELGKFYPRFTSVRLFSLIEVAKRIEKGIDGKYGLIDWPEILPKTARDKIYIILKRTGKPLHFTKIAELCNNLNSELNIPHLHSKRKILPQTAHNELIRDERFVLVGRGLYALKEWGYQPGTVFEVVQRILKNSQRPLSQEEILNLVRKQRIVKENTILLALNNKDNFFRDQEGRYRIKTHRSSRSL